MSRPELALSPARHAPAILGSAVVLAMAAAGLAGVTAGAMRAPDTRALDRVAAIPAVAAPPSPAPPGPYVAAGTLRSSFYDDAVAAGATPEGVRQAVALFSRKLDFARDLRPGAPFRLVFERAPAARGRATTAGDLLYAEVGARGDDLRLYRFSHDGRADYLDAAGRAAGAPLLLRTPVDGARVTSGFGMRLHPILGFNRLHPGVDFGAPLGSPVLAAGDGTVEEAGWAGGYGRWLKIAHADGYETGYGHLLRYAPGVRPGARVTQGQVVAFVGSSGLSTGPHLHFEMLRGGRKLDPSTAPAPADRRLDRAARSAFAEQKARIDAALAAPPPLRVAHLG